MALGNANSSAQSRGKNKAVVVKRRKEVVIAKDYNTVTMSPPQANPIAACTYSGDGYVTYYHNGSNALPAVNDTVYNTRRAKNPNSFTAGYYQMAVGKNKIALNINSAGLVLSGSPC
tara:strand:- start:51 stop:401 length:351 start_codon:yes stop_codon:yes gene_type:complete